MSHDAADPAYEQTMPDSQHAVTARHLGTVIDERDKALGKLRAELIHRASLEQKLALAENELISSKLTNENMLTELAAVKVAAEARDIAAQNKINDLEAENSAICRQRAEMTDTLNKHTAQAHKEALALNDRIAAEISAGKVFLQEVEDLRERNRYLGNINGQLQNELQHLIRVVLLLQKAIDDPQLLKGS